MSGREAPEGMPQTHANMEASEPNKDKQIVFYILI